MFIVKPSWITHSDTSGDSRGRGIRPCLYSLHVHPDGKRLATGGLDATVRIWNTKPIYDENAENDPNCHKLLCTMTRHNGAVLCVRWSNNDGRYLASSSDNDNVVIIWELDSEGTTGATFGSFEHNHEPWRAKIYLRGHQSDVQDLAWSRDNKYLASCGVDGAVIVWDGTSFERVVRIDQHAGFVKGIAWDPVGKYLASQSDDKVLKIWRTSDWRLEKEIRAPFVNAPGTTLFRRLSWSPDGSQIVTANAVNGNYCVSAVIRRGDWTNDISLVGHQLPVEAACFNPKLFYAPELRDDTVGEVTESGESLAALCALGGQDRGVSLWVTKYNRPLCMAADVFDNNVYDLSWTPDGQWLYACSHDGTVACLKLDDGLMRPAPDEEIERQLSKYGYKDEQATYPESPSQLELEQQNAITEKTQSSRRIAVLMGTSDPGIGSSNSQRLIEASSEGVSSTNGGRAEQPVPKSADQTKNGVSAQHTVQQLAERTTTGPITQQTAPQPADQMINGTSTQQAGSGPTEQPIARPTDADFTSSSGTSSATVLQQQTVTVGKDGKRRITPVNVRSTTSVSPRLGGFRQALSHDEIRAVLSNSASSRNEKIEYSYPSADIPESGIAAIATGNKRKADAAEAMDVDTMQPVTRKRPVWLDASMVPPSASQSQVRLAVPMIKSQFLRNIRYGSNEGVVMECRNPTSLDHKVNGDCAKVSVSCRGDVIWSDYLSSAVLLMDGNDKFFVIACEDGSIHTYSKVGQRIMPPFVLSSTAVILQSIDQWLLCLTANGLLYTWDIIHRNSCLSEVSVAPVLKLAQLPDNQTTGDLCIRDIRIQPNGIPLVVTNYQQAFIYHPGMKVWMRISDAWYIISEFWNTAATGTPKDHPLGWLSMAVTVKGGLDPAARPLMELVDVNTEASGIITASYLEIQLGVAAILNSPIEYKEWLMRYARCLSKENAQRKIQELCRWLIGPPFISNDSDVWEPTILGLLSKRELLKQILPILASNRQLQRIVSEYKAILDEENI